MPQQSARHYRLTKSSTFLAACLLPSLLFQTAGTSAADIKITDRLPYGQSAIDYFASSVQDPVAQLNARLQSGTDQLASGSGHGFLQSVLRHLAVPPESQLLVFSKTSRTPALVSPRTPRAVYFNDSVSVAWIPGAKELELTAIDPSRGVNFYTLQQPPSGVADGTVAAFVRQDRCLACHAGRSSIEVPGLLLRGFQTDRNGRMLYGISRTTHATQLDRRWGGWYVTGSPPDLIHRANLISKTENQQHRSEPGLRSALPDLSTRGDFSDWPVTTSDFVAHLIFAHQVHGTNLLVRVGMESRLQRHSDALNHLLRYLVFADEAPLRIRQVDADRLRQTPYAKYFQEMKTTTGQADALRELDLSDRIFRNRLSFLVNTPLFDGLPAETRTRLLIRLWHGLTDPQPEEMFRHLEVTERQRIVRILLATKPDLPAPWNSAAVP